MLPRADVLYFDGWCSRRSPTILSSPMASRCRNDGSHSMWRNHGAARPDLRPRSLFRQAHAAEHVQSAIRSRQYRCRSERRSLDRRASQAVRVSDYAERPVQTIAVGNLRRQTWKEASRSRSTPVYANLGQQIGAASVGALARTAISSSARSSIRRSSIAGCLRRARGRSSSPEPGSVPGRGRPSRRCRDGRSAPARIVPTAPHASPGRCSRATSSRREGDLGL